MQQIYTKGTLTISNGCMTGKILVTGLLLIFAIYFIIRARMQWKIIEKMQDNIQNQEVQWKVKRKMSETEQENTTDKEMLEQRKFRQKVNRQFR